MKLNQFDVDINKYILEEKHRQETHLELIASENFVSEAVLEAQGSILTNKYAEGYPKHRYYGGCEFVDEIEEITRTRLKILFDAKYVNVQPHSGSQANMAVYQALLKPGDKILGMSLSEGGHLTHGFKLNFSGKIYQSFFYGVDKETECINYNHVRDIALEVKPQLIIAGASAYARVIDFKKFREIADEVGAYLLVDMAHIAGLIAAKQHPSPLPYAHVVTSTTHKTLRGPRGGIILTNDEINPSETLEDVEELSSYNGTVIYKYNTEEDDSFVYGSESFARVAKVQDKDNIYLNYGKDSLQKTFKLDKNLQGTIALCGVNEEDASFLSRGYRYKQVKIEKVEE